MKRIAILIKMLAVIMLMCGLSGCVVEVEEASNPYSRDYVTSYCESTNFGYGKTDDEYVALQYIYSNEELKNRYGDTFEVSDFGGSADLNSIFDAFEGEAEYFFTIDDDEWSIKLHKDYSSKWIVDDCVIFEER